MRASSRRSNRKARFTAAAVLGALALAVPISSASAATNPFAFWSGAAARSAFPSALSAFPIAQQGSVGGAVFSQGINGTVAVSGCGSNRPSVIGGAGSLDQQVCGNVLAFVGPSIGQINSQVGPTIIGSVINAPVTMSAGPVVNIVP
ncbi:MAG TPA: hypothetical protein VGO39_00270 [Gaiellaceae bacterium]|jgi:hypothetical protein|nr:hypothetical protein [Gaiellaceae bacterium]